MLYTTKSYDYIGLVGYLFIYTTIGVVGIVQLSLIVNVVYWIVFLFVTYLILIEQIRYINVYEDRLEMKFPLDLVRKNMNVPLKDVELIQIVSRFSRYDTGRSFRVKYKEGNKQKIVIVKRNNNNVGKLRSFLEGKNIEVEIYE